MKTWRAVTPPSGGDPSHRRRCRSSSTGDGNRVLLCGCVCVQRKQMRDSAVAGTRELTFRSADGAVHRWRW